MEQYDTVLVIQDTTTFNYIVHPTTKGLGIYRNKQSNLGFLSHTVLAVSVDGVPLGILSNQTWTRDPKELGKRANASKRPIENKESYKLLAALDESLQGIPSYINTVTVCDREADIYDFIHE